MHHCDGVLTTDNAALTSIDNLAELVGDMPVEFSGFSSFGYLKSLLVDYAQGYYFSIPQPLHLLVNAFMQTQNMEIGI